VEIKTDLLIRILKKLEDRSNWYKAGELCDALDMKKEGESVFVHGTHLIQLAHVEQRRNSYMEIKWRITPSGREYLKELLTPEAGFRAD